MEIYRVKRKKVCLLIAHLPSEVVWAPGGGSQALQISQRT